MSGTTLDKLLEEIRTLEPDEQQRLRAILESWLVAPPSRTKEDELDEVLLRRGMLSRIPPPALDHAPSRERTLAEVKGKPVSETIVEERR